MNIHVYEGKDERELLEKAYTELNCDEETSLHSINKTKVGLMKKEVTKLSIVTYEEIIIFIKSYLNNLTKDMGLDVTFESKIRDKQITVKMYSNNNSILIGKNGQTLQALTTILKQVIYNEIGSYPYLILDVENYKEKQAKHLERLAKNVAREVAETKVEVALENMNSYERRIIHNVLTNSNNVYTESVGEEPNRHIIVKPKED